MNFDTKIVRNQKTAVDIPILLVDVTPRENEPFTFVCKSHQPRSIHQCLFLAIGL